MDSSPGQEKVCWTKELGVVLLPCSHMATCIECSSQLSSCPICRTKINAYVRVFLP
ncbi:hypothetical protein B566_EDAN012954 [Ephemera danica]|nr:hypothetical protein B566_EDAN012954 [Ephemera danica]